MYIGDLPQNQAVRKYFSTTKSDGTSITMATNGTLYAHKQAASTTVTITTVSTGIDVLCTTSAVHNLTTGDYVWITGAVGMTELNGLWQITVYTTTTFFIDGETGVGWGTYTASSASSTGLKLTTVGITFTEDFLGTGMHLVEVVTTDAFYATGSDYELLLIGATIDTLAVNSPLFSWSIENRFMRGTDNANTTKTGYSISGTKTTLDALNDIAATAIVSGGAINTTAGAVDSVTLVTTTTTNTDQRGTDGAALATGVQLNAQGKLDVNAEADQALLDAGATVTRHGYLDNLNVGGLVASSSEATAIQNNTRVVRVVPPAMERPDTGSTLYTLDLYLYDTLNNMEAPDALPTVTARNHAGVTRSANLSAVTLVAVGHYQVTYTVASTHAKEALTIEWSVVEGGNTRLYGSGTMVVDDAASTFTAGDRTKLDTLHDVRLTAPRATNLDNLDAAVSTRNAIAPQTAQQIRDSMKLSPAAGAPSAGSVDEHLDNIPTAGTDGDIVRNGTAQGGSVSTITLDAGASATDGNYDNDLVVITSGTGAGQSESVSSYVGATKLATMAANWKTAPDNTSVFSLYGRGTVAGATAPTTAQIADAVHDELLAGHNTTGSFGALVSDMGARFAGTVEFDRTTSILTVKNADGSTRFTLTTREKPTDPNIQEVVRT